MLERRINHHMCPQDGRARNRCEGATSTAFDALGRVADGSLGSLDVFRRERFLDKVLVSLVILRLSDAKAAKIANAATLPTLGSAAVG